jgi:hypothetical protein
MQTGESLMSQQIKQFYQDCCERYTSDEKRIILVSHCGTFSQDLINSLVEGNEGLMNSVGDKKILIKRVFSILIEGLQNIRVHGELDELQKQLGFVLIAKNKESYKINFGNIIKSIKSQGIIDQIEHLNSLSSPNLKMYHTKVLTEEMFSEKGGAGLGFITMKMKSNNPLNYSIHTLSDQQSFFSVEVLLSRLN